MFFFWTNDRLETSSDCPPEGDWPRWPRDPSCDSGDAASTWDWWRPGMRILLFPLGTDRGQCWHENMVKAWEHGWEWVNHHKMGKHHQYSNHLLVCGFNQTINMEGWPIQKCGLKLWSPGKEYGDVTPPNPRSYTVTHTAWWRKLWTTHQLERGRFTQAMVNVVNSWKWGSDKQEWDNGPLLPHLVAHPT